MQAELQDGIDSDFDAVATDIAAADTAGAEAGLDAELFERIGVAEQCRADYMEARDARLQLLDALRDHPEYKALHPDSRVAQDKYRELAHSTGYLAADTYCRRQFDHYDKAVRAVMLCRAHTVDGVRAKLRLGRHAASRGEGRVYAYGDYEWLIFTLADLEGW